jgi:hypothetical protein
VQTYKSVLQIYGLHLSKEAAILQSAPVQGQDQFRRVDLYLQSSIVLSNAGMAIANDLVCDARSILLGFSDGSFQCFSWHCKVNIHSSPCLILSPQKKEGFGGSRLWDEWHKSSGLVGGFASWGGHVGRKRRV